MKVENSALNRQIAAVVIGLSGILIMVSLMMTGMILLVATVTDIITS